MVKWKVDRASHEMTDLFNLESPENSFFPPVDRSAKLLRLAVLNGVEINSFSSHCLSSVNLKTNKLISSLRATSSTARIEKPLPMSGNRSNFSFSSQNGCVVSERTGLWSTRWFSADVLDH